MAKTQWTQAMDGSPAEVDLFEVVAGNPRTDGDSAVQWWDSIVGQEQCEEDWGHIVWQHGPIQEVGRNGILFEELLEFVVIPRLQGFNRDRIPNPEFLAWVQDPKSDVLNGEKPEPTIPNPFRNRETSLAITHLEEGLNWLKRRAELRRRQNVEGTFQPHKS